MNASRLRCITRRLVKYCRRNSIRQCSCRIVPCSRSTKPLAGQGGRVLDAEEWAGVAKGRLELGAAVGEDPLQRPPGSSIERDQDLAEEGGGRFQPRHTIG